MNPLWFIPLYIYVVVGFFSFMALNGRWTNPWPWDKALVFGLFWLPCIIFGFVRGVFTGFVKLIKDEVLR